MGTSISVCIISEKIEQNKVGVIELPVLLLRAFIYRNIINNNNKKIIKVFTDFIRFHSQTREGYYWHVT